MPLPQPANQSSLSELSLQPRYSTRTPRTCSWRRRESKGIRSLSSVSSRPFIYYRTGTLRFAYAPPGCQRWAQIIGRKDVMAVPSTDGHSDGPVPVPSFISTVRVRNSSLPTFSKECGVSGAPQAAVRTTGVDLDALVSASTLPSGSRRTKSLVARM
jgi:hypothetical protein